ncbi:hypothetical protein NST99_20405 [Paenibacillus sp. FSL L8-0470]|uniref:hypothetical protein n=1 Tax=Paenibacillus sp. FSL L8-0470 TaxID=2954688 RepID=UPI0030F87D21
MDYINLFLFKRMLNNTYRKIKVEKVSRYLYTTDELLQRYKLVPKKNLNLLKLKLESEEYNNTSMTQIIDMFHKLVISITTAAIAVTITISVANLSFLKDNKILQEDQTSWIENVQINLLNFSNGMGFYIKFLLVCSFVFVVFSLHSQIQHTKNNLKKKHLRFIEEALKEDD